MARYPASTTCSPLLALPLELRLDIYAYLLCSHPDPIFISPRRRQVHLRRAPEDPASCSAVLSPAATAAAVPGGGAGPGRRGQKSKRRRRRSKPLPLPPGQRQPYVEVLRTCRQVNEEATPVLYGGRNTFVVAWFRLQPYHPPWFFPWYLRQSTLAQIRRITFQSGCYCAEKWVAAEGRSQAWTTTGARLARKCFPHVNYGSGRGFRRGGGSGNSSSSIRDEEGRGGGGGGRCVNNGGTKESRTEAKSGGSLRPAVASSSPYSYSYSTSSSLSSLLPMGRRAKEAYDMVTNEIMHDRSVVPTVCLTCHIKLGARRRSKTGLYTQGR